MSSPQNIVDSDGEPQESLLELFFGVLRECRDLLCCWKRSKSPRKPSLAPRDIRPVGKAVTVRKTSGKSLEVSDKGSTISPDSTSRLQALVIGIDHYRSNGIKDLEGAVKDADKISKYLCTHLGVPSAQIVNLRNGAATRKAIVRELKALPKRKGACEGDPFFIFFAGHGTTAAAPDGWITSTKDISMIVPHDGTANGKDDQGNEHNIPDRTIGALLNQLSESKGGNITVIFDCCHSGSGTRGDIEGPEYDTGESEEDDSPSDSDLDDDVPERPRGFEMEDSDSYTLPGDIDETIWSETFQRCRGAVEQVGFAMSGTKSHVLLAACREGERAFERGSSGAFTTALLKVLETQPANSMPQLTYHNLMARVKASLKRQHPQCEGYYSNRC